MNTDQNNESGETTAPADRPSMLRPLTPDEWEQNQKLCDALLDYMLGDGEQNSKPQG